MQTGGCMCGLREATDVIWHLCKEESKGVNRRWRDMYPSVAIRNCMATSSSCASLSHWQMLGTQKGRHAFASLLFAATLSGLNKQFQSLSHLSSALVSYLLLFFAVMGFPGCASSWLFISWYAYKSPCLLWLEFYHCICCCLNPPTWYSHLSPWIPWSFSMVPHWTYGKVQAEGAELLIYFYLFSRSPKLGRTSSLSWR